MIRIENVSKQFGSFSAVRGLSLHVGRGEIFGFLGVNGAGKTTTLRMLVAVLNPTSGRIFIDDIDNQQQPLAAKRITGYIPDRPYLYGKLTGREFLGFMADLYDVDTRQAERRISELLEEYGLQDWQDELIESYSHGMRQRLATCAALVHNPRLLVVDEPMVGLDPHGAKLLKTAFRRYAQEGMTIFLSTHSLNVAEEVADRLAIIHRGSLITSGTLADIRRQTGDFENGLEDMFLELTSAAQED